MKFKSYKMKTKYSTWGLRFDILSGRIYLGLHLGYSFKSWWLEWGPKEQRLMP